MRGALILALTELRTVHSTLGELLEAAGDELSAAAVDHVESCRASLRDTCEQLQTELREGE